jgi:hypothetical protein
VADRAWLAALDEESPRLFQTHHEADQYRGHVVASFGRSFRAKEADRRRIYGASCYYFYSNNDAPNIHTRSVMGLKKRRLSRSGAANHAIIATSDGSS